MTLHVASVSIEEWQLAALCAIVFLAAYGIAAKQFFNEKHDWRAFIPLILVAGLVLTAYYLYSGAYRTVGTGSYAFALGLGAIFAVSSLLSLIAIKDGPISIVVPLLSLNLVLVVIAGILLFKEQLTAYKIAGIVLGLASIILLTIENR